MITIKTKLSDKQEELTAFTFISKRLLSNFYEAIISKKIFF